MLDKVKNEEKTKETKLTIYDLHHLNRHRMHISFSLVIQTYHVAEFTKEQRLVTEDTIVAVEEGHLILKGCKSCST